MNTTYKPGTITLTTKSKTECLSMAKYLHRRAEHLHFDFETDLYGLPDRCFGDVFEVIAFIPECELVSCKSDSGSIWHIPLVFIRYFVEW